MVLPKGVTLGTSTVSQMMIDEFTAIIKAIVISIFLIFLVMAMQFESPRFSAMVMVSIPFAMIGSFGLLYVTGSTLSMVSLMGVLMLVGIVVNNGILYVDTANQLREEMPLEEALIQSGQLRLRPILMTTLTTILSMVPMSLGIGDGSVIMQGMALIIIGGLITSTILILLLMPTFYLLIDKRSRKEQKEAKKAAREAKKAEKEAAKEGSKE
jgi:HAE1 family hydrophobic/amphiphilic exporter-1